MGQLSLIKVMWLKDEEAHMDVPDSGTWWMRQVSKLGGGTCWELNDGQIQDENEPVGYFDTDEDVFEWLSKEHSLDVVITRDDR
jgi:hypothetical protein